MRNDIRFSIFDFRFFIYPLQGIYFIGINRRLQYWNRYAVRPFADRHPPTADPASLRSSGQAADRQPPTADRPNASVVK
jgi:hypothetical protein